MDQLMEVGVGEYLCIASLLPFFSGRKSGFLSDLGRCGRFLVGLANDLRSPNYSSLCRS